jgi:acyl carrier protein
VLLVTNRNYEISSSSGKGTGQTFMHTLRIKPAIALIATLILLSGCENKFSQTSNSKARVDKPTQVVSSDPEQILSGIRNIVAKQLNLEASAVDVDAPLAKQKVAADELDVVEIIMGIEETFGIEIKDEEVSNPEGHLKNDLSVRTLVDIVVKKKGKK